MSGELNGKRVAFLATDGVEEVELVEPRKAVEQAGAETVIVSLNSGEIQAFNHLDPGDKIKVDVTVGSADAAQFDALVLPGGVANPDMLRGDQDAVRFVKAFFDQDKPVGVICHGPWTLVEADVVRGRTLTSWPTLQTDLRNAGAEWVDEEVHVDGRLVSSRNPDDLPSFNRKVVEVFAAGGEFMKIGYFLSSEEFGPKELVSQAVKAQEAGFEDLWISDHFHPWNDEQCHSGFVWATIGAIAQAAPGMAVTTAVTCPTMRVHPAVIAQAAATSAVLLDGKFALGVGTGEALNEHIFGDRWPSAAERREMLEEAVAVIRQLWGGGVQSHSGKHYQVDHARIYDLPDEMPKILVSGFGPRSIELAAEIGDGFVTVEPDADAVSQYRSQAKREQLVGGGLKVCYDNDEKRAKQTAYRLWPNEALPGELAQILPTPAHFEQACELISEDVATESVPCGPDLDKHIAAIRAYEEAGFDELYIQQIGPNQDAFFEAYRQHVLPQLDGRLSGAGRS